MSDIEESAEGAGPVRLAITMGDPTGIGPEVILKALSQKKALEGEGPPWLASIFGKPAVLEAEDRHLSEVLDDYQSPLVGPGRVEVIDAAPEVVWEQRARGQGGPQAARLQGASLEKAMEAVAAGSYDAIVTAPWNKALFAQIGEETRGHTEVLAEFFGAKQVVMMLGGDRLRVALVTTHIALGEVAEAVTVEGIEQTAEVTARALRERFGVRAPRIAFCGLNPHAGESGHMGREEIEVIIPAIERLRARRGLAGVSWVGPKPSDTLFAGFMAGEAPYDAVICMYHDQGLIPLKMLHFGESANITLGLPVVRTSVDHGTAYDIAGRGVADAGSMVYALGVAAKMVRREEYR